MKNSDKIILDLCGGTAAWSRPYKDAGYDVRVITLPIHDVLSYSPPRRFMEYSPHHPAPCFQWPERMQKLRAI